MPQQTYCEPFEEDNAPSNNIKPFFSHEQTIHPEHNKMSLEKYNKLMSDMLNQRCALAKLRAELEGREGRICRKCGRFRHLAQKCRSEEEQEKKAVGGNRFKVVKSRVMQCGVKEVRRQEVVREEAKCFGCREKGHKK